MTELPFLTASKLAPLIKQKQVSPVEIMASIIHRMEQVEPMINAYITPLPDQALEQAKKAERDILNGNYLGPLHGIPIGIKDNFYTKNIRTTSGSSMLNNFTPDQDATTVKLLKEQGSIITGKLNLHEFAQGLTNINPHFGSSKNPWNLSHMTGGSSGGSAAALAAGLTTLATGTDTFGSIRGPAAMCGIYGIKPTYGLVSTNGITPLTWSLDHPGPMARSVSDLALMLSAMAGYDPKDPASLNIEIPDYTKALSGGIKGLRMGVPSYFLRGLEPEVERSFKKACKNLEAMGAHIEEINIPELEMATFSEYVILTTESASIHHGMLQQSPIRFGKDVRVMFETGELLPTINYIQSQQFRRQLIKSFKKVFQKVDVLLGPSLPITAPAFQSDWVLQNLETIERCMPFTAPANLTGVPSISVPISESTNQLPIGMQIIGNHLSEELLFQIASEWEEHRGVSLPSII